MNPTADGFRQYHDALSASLSPSPRHPQGTGGGRFEPTTFDYIMTKGLGSPRADLIDVPEEASDHRPVALEIELSAH
jgi:endonuclease/exonuclease/phosphatase family metal-dependent hydrolase